MQVGSLVCAAIALAAAAIVAGLLPARARQATPSTAAPEFVEAYCQAGSTRLVVEQYIAEHFRFVS
jgi:hypothetical protein